MPPRTHLLTELRLPASTHLDTMSVSDALAIMNQQDAIATAAVAKESASIAKAITLVTTAFQNNGRLFYIGAGTSGRLRASVIPRPARVARTSRRSCGAIR